jgi:peptidoglycan/LPS O-acetylase OafA/YrhL
LILALSVFFWHIPGHPFRLVHGGIAVEAFFIISGFYMALVINEKYSRLPHSSWISSFYQSRILRLAPTYFVICLVEGLLYMRSNTPNIFSGNDLTLQARSALFFMNFFIFGQDMWQTILTHSATNIPNSFVQSAVNFFGKSALEPIYIYIGQAWSLGIELIFYAMAPFVVMSRTRVIALFITCLLIRFYFVEHADLFPNAPWRSRFFASNMIFFFLGTMSYWIYARAVRFEHAKTVGRMVAILGMCSLIGSVYFAGGMFLFDGPEDYDQIRLWIFYLLFTAGMPFLFILTKDIKWDSYIGEISYPLYLVHGFMIGSLNYLRFGPSVKLALIIAATLAVSTALFVFVDRPVDRFRHKLTASPKAIGGRPSLYRSIRYSLSAVPVLLFLLVISRPTTEASPVPHLVKEVGRYNIVAFNGKFYGIPQGIAVNWQKA